MCSRRNIRSKSALRPALHTVGFKGNLVVRTPMLDRLAETYAHLDAAGCQAPPRATSRTSMLDGKCVRNCSG